MTIGPLDTAAARATAEHLDRLTKPRGALGRLETTAVRLSAIAGVSPPPVPEPVVVAVFAGDHGVLAQGVTPWPKDVTAQMVVNVARGGAAINVLARQAGATVVAVDVGVDGPGAEWPAEVLVRRVRNGTADLSVEAAMLVEEAEAAFAAGRGVGADFIGGGAGCLVTGEMGIGNTTPSAALIAWFAGRPAEEVTGRGTGIDDPTLARKVDAIGRGLARTRAAGIEEPMAVLASLGGLEIAALAGYVTAGAEARVPVVIDGVIALAALCVAAAIEPAVTDYVFAGHRSTEPGTSVALDHLGLTPLLDLELRLGEGTGAMLAVPVLQASARIVREMATFDSAGVTEKD